MLCTVHQALRTNMQRAGWPNRKQGFGQFADESFQQYAQLCLSQEKKGTNSPHK